MHIVGSCPASCPPITPQEVHPRTALNSFPTQPVLVLGTALTQMQDIALGLVELHDVHTVQLLQPIQVPLDGPLPSLCSCSTQPDVTSKLAEGALNPTAAQSQQKH